MNKLIDILRDFVRFLVISVLMTALFALIYVTVLYAFNVHLLLGVFAILTGGCLLMAIAFNIGGPR